MSKRLTREQERAMFASMNSSRSYKQERELHVEQYSRITELPFDPTRYGHAHYRVNREESAMYPEEYHKEWLRRDKVVEEIYKNFDYKYKIGVVYTAISTLDCLATTNSVCTMANLRQYGKYGPLHNTPVSHRKAVMKLLISDGLIEPFNVSDESQQIVITAKGRSLVARWREYDYSEGFSVNSQS